MTGTYALVIQQAKASTTPPALNREQLREQIRQTVADAQQAAAEAKASQGAQAGRSGTRVIVTENGVMVGPAAPAPPAPPGFTLQSGGGGGNNVIPSQAVDMAYGFMLMCAVMVIGWPLARAFGRRIENKAVTAQLPPAAGDQLMRIEQAVEAMAIEVERISEAQRYQAKIQSGSRAERV